MFCKRSAAAYAIAETEKVIKSMNAPIDGLQKSIAQFQEQFEKAATPAEQLIESKTKAWTDFPRPMSTMTLGLRRSWPILQPMRRALQEVMRSR